MARPSGSSSCSSVLTASSAIGTISAELTRGIRREPLVRALDERARREASLSKRGRGFQARSQERVGLRQAAAFVVEVAELGLHPGALAWIGDAELERRREPRRRFAVGHRRGRSLGRAKVVVDRALGAGDGGGDGEVMGELGQDAREIGRIDLLERFADEEMQLRQADARIGS